MLRSLEIVKNAVCGMHAWISSVCMSMHHSVLIAVLITATRFLQRRINAFLPPLLLRKRKRVTKTPRIFIDDNFSGGPKVKLKLNPLPNKSDEFAW